MEDWGFNPRAKGNIEPVAARLPDAHGQGDASGRRVHRRVERQGRPVRREGGGAGAAAPDPAVRRQRDHGRDRRPDPRAADHSDADPAGARRAGAPGGNRGSMARIDGDETTVALRQGRVLVREAPARTRSRARSGSTRSIRPCSAGTPHGARQDKAKSVPAIREDARVRSASRRSSGVRSESTSGLPWADRAESRKRSCEGSRTMSRSPAFTDDDRSGPALRRRDDGDPGRGAGRACSRRSACATMTPRSSS